MNDAERLDWLEWMANKPEGLVLHSGHRGLEMRPGLGLANTGRTLREAVDDAMRYDNEWRAVGKTASEPK